jgi:hypothetical protein
MNNTVRTVSEGLINIQIAYFYFVTQLVELHGSAVLKT